MYASIMSPITVFQETERMSCCLDRWEKPCRWEGYDTINITENELGKMLPKLESMSQAQRFQFFDHPSLLNFVLNIKSECHRGTAKILFKKTLLTADDGFIELGENTKQKNFPFVDAYVSFDGDDQHDVVISMGYAVLKADKDTMHCTTHHPVWFNRNVDRDFFINSPFWQETIRNVKLAYLIIQKAIQDRPTVFSERQISRPIECSGKKKKKKRKVRVIRVLRVNRDEFTEYVKTHRKIECPCWGVIGHWRNYKSGKKVWIAPYRKGRERGNPNAYSPKEYQLEEESVCK